MNLKLFLLISLSVILSACDAGLVNINYGHDACHYCKMTIADQRYAAEFVSDKGKVFKFDAIECMADFIIDNPETEYSILAINSYDLPGELLIAQQCIFLISKELPSPMGANLTAFKDHQKAAEMKKQKGGNLFSWEEILHQRKIKQSGA